MKSFEGKRDFETIIKNAEKKGYTVDKERFEKNGIDHIFLINEDHKIAYNVCNGGFMIFDVKGNFLASHMSENLDNEEWYQEILEMFYIPWRTADEKSKQEV